MRSARALAGVFGVIAVVLTASLVLLVSARRAVAAGGDPPVPTGVDIQAASGLWDQLPVRWYGTYPFDVNGDGAIDVLLDPHESSPGHLMLNDGFGHFTETQAGTWFTRDRHDCAWADVQQDGRPDVYCTLGGDHGQSSKSNELWIQHPDGSFEDKAVAFGVSDPYGRGRAVTFVDVNHDEWPDLYVSNAYPRADGRASPNRLFLNDGGVAFHRAPEYRMNMNVGQSLTVHSCAQAVDYDQDTWEDLLVCGKRGLHLFRNRANTYFTDQAVALSIASGVWYQAQLVDMNQDGRLDLVGVRKGGFWVQLGAPRRFLAPVKLETTLARQLAVGDVNADGAPDVYVVRGASALTNLPDLMLINDGSGTKFLPASIPHEPGGSGQSVRAADLDGDLLPEMIVTNGYLKTAGTLQLISFAP